MSERILKNGDRVNGVIAGYCGLCSIALTGSGGGSAIYLMGEFYHLQCFPDAAAIWKAQQDVREASSD